MHTAATDKVSNMSPSVTVVLSLLVATIATGGLASTMSCLRSQCSAKQSLYEQHCCKIGNYGRAIRVTKGGRHYHILCPTTRPKQCMPITSCSDVSNNGGAISGYYDIILANGNTANVYCNMEGCDGEGGWTRVAYLDMSDTTQQCPTNLRLYHVSGVRACGRQTSSVGGCNSVTFSTYGISYSQVCGRVLGYQYGSTDAISDYDEEGSGIDPSSHNNINAEYVDGVSITRGSPRQHIWTLMAGSTEGLSTHMDCPCNAGSTVSVQSFIGNDYFCESANTQLTWSLIFYPSDPLWDGEGCGGIEGACCNVPNIPWFYKQLSSSNTNAIELRVCTDQSTSDEDIRVSMYEIYVK